MVGPVDRSVGYTLKRAAGTLRTAMDNILRPLDLTVPQYSCLEVLSQRPGLSNAELARAVFVTRQSMNLVLRGLQDRGLLTRPTIAPHGRALPSWLTPLGHEQLHAASAAVRTVEVQMLTLLTAAQRDRLLGDLLACVDALTPHAEAHRAQD